MFTTRNTSQKNKCCNTSSFPDYAETRVSTHLNQVHINYITKIYLDKYSVSNS